MNAQLNKVAYITGTSSGIGKALAHKLLAEGFHVVGFSRRNDIDHPQFEHRKVDLSDLKTVSSIQFNLKGAQTILVNNAGIVGDIKRIGSIQNDAIIQLQKVNTIAPQLLCNNFVATFKEEQGAFNILNISSGAGKSPIDAWSSYCASKAALDLFSETIAGELEWMEKENWSVHSCAPGVVDTEMQADIRSAKSDDFSRLSYFQELKSNNELFSADYVADKLHHLLQNSNNFPQVLVSVRDF